MSTFSERQGIIQPESLKTDDMPDELRNRLWNVIKNYIDKEFHGDQKRDVVMELLWDKFFKENKDTLKRWTSYR